MSGKCADCKYWGNDVSKFMHEQRGVDGQYRECAYPGVEVLSIEWAGELNDNASNIATVAEFCCVRFEPKTA